MKLRPDDAAGNNGLGAALVAAQDTPSKPFHTCNRGSRHVPIIEAHYNLGFALAGRKILKVLPSNSVSPRSCSQKTRM